MITQTYAVKGMTCDHCVHAVAAELTKLPGVVEVDVDLAGATATITSDTAVAVSDVAAAVDVAGYELGS